MSGEPLLSVEGLQSGYGDAQVLFNVSLSVSKGEVITLLGRNGMGKTTTVLTIMGLLRARSGLVAFNGTPIANLPPHAIAQLGIGFVPEGRQIFPTLTVRENLVATGANRNNAIRPWTYARVLELFPRLASRVHQLGTVLSGGEQQMLAIGRALMTNPELLIFDEATEGLAPLVREEIWRVISIIKDTGQSIIIIDKTLDALLRIATRHYVIEKGTVVWTGSSDDLRRSPDIQRNYVGL